jgi:hypothetical protein
MSLFKTFRVSAVLLFAVALIISSLSPVSMTAQVQMPEKLQKLQIFLGKWEGTGTLVHEGKTMDIKVKREAVKTADGWGIVITESMDVPGMGTHITTALLGYEVGHEHVHLYSISNHGNTQDNFGYWIDDQNFELKYEAMKDNKPLMEVQTYEFSGTNTLKFSSDTYLARNKVGSVQITYRKTST